MRDNTKILLDSGTSKIVNFIVDHNKGFTAKQILDEFERLIHTHKIIDKYVEVIRSSNIDEAVTLDAPNLFKTRGTSETLTTTIFTPADQVHHIELTARYANILHQALGKDAHRLLTIVNGLWSEKQLHRFMSLLKYKPRKFAIGGVTKIKASEFLKILARLDAVINLATAERVHFLGCGGIKNTAVIKSYMNRPEFSVDCSTPMNRAIDGSTDGAAQSGYFDYQNAKLHRITPAASPAIIRLHSQASNPIYTMHEMHDVLRRIFRHQSNHSNLETYDARAQLSLHNHDVFRTWAE